MPFSLFSTPPPPELVTVRDRQRPFSYLFRYVTASMELGFKFTILQNIFTRKITNRGLLAKLFYFLKFEYYLLIVEIKIPTEMLAFNRRIIFLDLFYLIPRICIDIITFTAKLCCNFFLKSFRFSSL